jgi:hypothetical protein
LPIIPLKAARDKDARKLISIFIQLGIFGKSNAIAADWHLKRWSTIPLVTV